MEVKIEIDDRVVPAGYEPVAFRAPERGEVYITTDERIECSVGGVTCARLILRKKYTPPAFFKPGWYAMDGNTHWYWYAVEPVVHTDGSWRSRDAAVSKIPPFIIWTPPEFSDWTQSKFEVKGDAP